jgi:hypothetical protein
VMFRASMLIRRRKRRISRSRAGSSLEVGVSEMRRG